MLLVDADSLVFKAGFAAERALYTLHVNPGMAIQFQKKRDLDAYVKEREIQDFQIEKERTLEPLENALSNLKNSMTKIVEKFPADELRVFMSGKDNFREHVDSQYKANRDPNHRPHWEPELREYLRRYWKAEDSNGMEADDAIGIAATEWYNHHDNFRAEFPVIASIDKDLRMIPAKHYNYDKETTDFVGIFDAEYHYYKQLLSGDDSDNVPGITGIGPKRAHDIVYDPTAEEPIWFRIRAMYEKEFGSEAEERFLKNRLLLWICRTREDVPSVEDVERILRTKKTVQRIGEPEVPWSSGSTLRKIHEQERGQEAMPNMPRQRLSQVRLDRGGLMDVHREAARNAINALYGAPN